MFNSFTCNIEVLRRGYPQSVLCMLRKKKFKIIRRILKFSKLTGMEKKNSTDLKAVLKSLSEDELDILFKSIQCKGGINSSCIVYNNKETLHLLKPLEIRFLMAQAFRFPNLTKECFLKRLVCCSQRDCSSREQCINPYHSSVVVDVAGNWLSSFYIIFLVAMNLT